MSSVRATFAATRVRAMFQSRLAAIPRDGISVFWYWTMTNPATRFSMQLRQFAYRSGLCRWGQTSEAAVRLGEPSRAGILWFSPQGSIQQVKITPAGQQGRIPAQVPVQHRATIQDFAVSDLTRFIDADDEALNGVNDACFVWVVETVIPERYEPGPVCAGARRESCCASAVSGVARRTRTRQRYRM